MNKTDVVKKLQEKTGLTEEKCIVLEYILENHFIIGRNNKEKIVKDIMEKLDVPAEKADELYNNCMEVIVKGTFKRK